MATLTPLELLQGSFSLVFVIISLILGITIMLKYLQFKTRNLILAGATLIFLVSPYWPDAINFVFIISGGSEIDVVLYFIIANVFISPLHITWILFWTDLKYKDNQKIIVAIFAIEAIIYEIIIISYFFIDISLIGTKLSTFVVQWGDTILIYLVISILMFLITGFIMVKDALKAQDKEIKLKGKFLLFAFVLFTIGTLIDVLFADTPSEITIVLARIFLTISYFSFYIGFTMPNFIKKRFIK